MKEELSLPSSKNLNPAIEVSLSVGNVNSPLNIPTAFYPPRSRRFFARENWPISEIKAPKIVESPSNLFQVG